MLRRHAPLAAAAIVAFAGLAAAQHAGDGQQHAPSNPRRPVYHDRAAADPGAPAGRVVFEETSHDFGDVLDLESMTHVFPFRNDGEGELVIHSVNSSCGCTVPTLEKTVYKPGETGEISVTFNPSGKRNEQDRRITVHTSDPENQTVTLTLKAFVEPLVYVEPQMITFGNVPKGTIQSRLVTVTGRGEGFELTAVQVRDNPAVSADIIGFTETEIRGKPARQYDVELTLEHTAAPGPIRGVVVFATNDPRRQEATTSVSGAVLGEVRVSSDRLPLGIVPIGQAMERKVTVSRRDGKPLNLLEAEVTGEHGENTVTAEIIPPEPMSEEPLWTVRLSVRGGQQASALRGNIVLHTDVPGEERIEIPFFGTVRNPVQTRQAQPLQPGAPAGAGR